MPSKEPTFFETAAEFRAWLRRHGGSAPELIVGFHKRDSGLPSMSWPESVDEALCFGWIDGVRASIDAQSYRIRFTPRRPTSTWSAINIARVKVLQIEGRMAPAGLEAFARRSEAKSRTYAYEQAQHAELSPAQRSEFRKHRKAWQFFEAQPTSYRHKAAWHVTSAKREETRQARLARLIEASANGQRI
ncbi:MAG: YdeI/OmpD-associated family protein [Rubrivivax sp.]|nr:YdeI/OmpD-associated family protein [Rubrivivax sp.]